MQFMISLNCVILRYDINDVSLSNKNSLNSMDDIVQTIVFLQVKLDEIVYNYIFYMIQMC